MKLHLQFTDTFSVVVCKATRKPQIYYTDLPIEAVENLGWGLYKHIQKLSDGGFTPSGTSVMIVDSCYNEQIKQLETGHLQFHGIIVKEQYGSI